MRKLIQLLIFIIIFQGCSDGSSEKVLQMEDIAPKAKNTLNKVNDPLKTKPIIGFSTVAAQWVGFKLDSIVPVDSLFFNDRFYPKKALNINCTKQLLKRCLHNGCLKILQQRSMRFTIGWIVMVKHVNQ